MSAAAYYLAVAAESVLSVFGIRGTYEQPPYQVVGQIPPAVELRQYGPRVAVQTAISDGGESAAFGRLFAYITGANEGAARIAMTVPVQRTDAEVGQRIAMTVPVEIGGAGVMRFFLPADVVAKTPPRPTDRAVQIATVPGQLMAVLRFSGSLTEASRQAQAAALHTALRGAGRQELGPVSVLSYDPPFAIPFLRRNEIAVEISAAPAGGRAPPGVETQSGG